jgi:CRP/FNR family cyclic AMP-dependent transcriptional regulator
MTSTAADVRVGYARLLDLDPDLAAGLAPDVVAILRRRAIVSTVTLGVGPWSPGDLPEEARHAETLLLTEGLVMRDVMLSDGTTSEILGPGDLLECGAPPESLLTVTMNCTVAIAATAVLVDRRLLRLLASWPRLGTRLLVRAATQTQRQSVMCAISQLPRVELRLLGLLWHLSDRWGHVATSGIVLPLTLTHESLGRLIGARRPTVSLALKSLAESGAVGRRADGAWILALDSREQLSPGDEPAPAAGVPLLIVQRTLPAGEPRRDAERWSAADREALAIRVRALRELHARQIARVEATLARCAETSQHTTRARRALLN